MLKVTVNILDVYQSDLNITASAAGGGTVNNFTINITAVNSTFNYSAGFSTTNGSIHVNLLHSNYTVIIDSNGYATTNDTFEIDVSNEEAAFTLFTTNSFNLIFRDETTDQLLNGTNVSIEFISDAQSSGVHNTANGSFFIDLLQPSDYTIRYSAPSFGERFYVIQLVNKTSTNITLYLLNQSATNVTITVTDTLSREIEGAIVKTLKYDVTTNSYTLVGMIQTNFEGKGNIDLVLNTEYYKFIIEYPLGTIRKTTNPTYIFATDLTFKVDLGDTVGDEFYFTQGIAHSLTFNNNTDIWTFTYNDATNTVTSGCLYLYKVDFFGQLLMTSTCEYSAASQMFVVTLGNESGATFIAEAYVTIDDEEVLLDSLIFTYAEDTRVLGKWGLFVVLLLTIVLGIMGFSWDINVGLILTPLPLFMGSVMGLIPLGIGYTLPIYLMILVIVYITISNQP